jgi:hypothetical protein
MAEVVADEHTQAFYNRRTWVRLRHPTTGRTHTATVRHWPRATGAVALRNGDCYARLSNFMDEAALSRGWRRCLCGDNCRECLLRWAGARRCPVRPVGGSSGTALPPLRPSGTRCCRARHRHDAGVRARCTALRGAGGKSRPCGLGNALCPGWRTSSLDGWHSTRPHPVAGSAARRHRCCWRWPVRGQYCWRDRWRAADAIRAHTTTRRARCGTRRGYHQPGGCECRSRLRPHCPAWARHPSVA